MNFLVQKRPWKRKRIMLSFSKVYIFSRTNYNLLSAKTLSAMTTGVMAKHLYPDGKL